MRSAATVAACAVALCGCGDDDNGGGGGSLSKDQYEERFREIVSAPGEETQSASPGATTPQEQAQEIDEGLDKMRSVATELDELEPPSDIAGAHAKFVAGLRAGADDSEALVRALRAGHERRAEAMIDSGTIFKPATVQLVVRARREFSEQGYELRGVSDFP